MFGDNAPIWRFLSSLSYSQHPERACSSVEGKYLLEVFPALALSSWIPEVMQRGRAAKYNPGRRKTFTLEDWQLVCFCVAARSKADGLTALAHWAEQQSSLTVPKKGDQDRLDASICGLIALEIGRRGFSHSLVMGDPRTGYIVAPASAEISGLLQDACSRVGVGINQFDLWS
jgi:predicted RNase H-like nuclease